MCATLNDTFVPKNQKKQQQIICKFFEEGFCRDGTKCPNIHQEKPVVVPDCRFFSLGKCKYGDKCKYNHSITKKNNIVSDCGLYKWLSGEFELLNRVQSGKIQKDYEDIFMKHHVECKTVWFDKWEIDRANGWSHGTFNCMLKLMPFDVKEYFDYDIVREDGVIRFSNEDDILLSPEFGLQLFFWVFLKKKLEL